jgi:membrane-bound ClpP family serine protease
LTPPRPGPRDFRRRSGEHPLLRYTLLQLPDVLFAALLLWALWAWWDLDARLAALLLALWVAKDALMYPFVRRALSGGPARVGAEALLGAAAVAETELAPRGWVRVRGEKWQAEARGGAPVRAGAGVRVCAVSGLVLEVELDPAIPASSGAPPRT